VRVADRVPDWVREFDCDCVCDDVAAPEGVVDAVIVCEADRDSVVDGVEVIERDWEGVPDCDTLWDGVTVAVAEFDGEQTVLRPLMKTPPNDAASVKVAPSVELTGATGSANPASGRPPAPLATSCHTIGLEADQETR
jgi:hypothetical protein